MKRAALILSLSLLLTACTTTGYNELKGKDEYKEGLELLGKNGGYLLAEPESKSAYQLGAIYYVPEKDYIVGQPEPLAADYIELEPLCKIIPSHDIDSAPDIHKTYGTRNVELNAKNTKNFKSTVRKILGIQADRNRAEDIVINVSNIHYEGLSELKLADIQQKLTDPKRKICTSTLGNFRKKHPRQELQISGILYADYTLKIKKNRNLSTGAKADNIPSTVGNVDANTSRNTDTRDERTGKMMVLKVYGEKLNAPRVQ